MASPAPKSPEQSEKAKKYDRQLRLWGDHGQAALEAGHVCLINATGLGTEILKSLVLPGVGSFTIIDGAKVTVEDLNTNFFVEPENIGKSRAEATTQLLLELNPDVKGDYVDEDVEQLLENSPDFFNNFSVVIATSLPERKLLPLAKKLWETGVPLLFCRSYGMACSIRIQVPEHTVAETHPDNAVPDIRIDRPFPGLVSYFESINFESLDQKDKAHVPYVIILLHYLKKWRETNANSLPSTYEEKRLFRSMIEEGCGENDEGIKLIEANHDEAIKAVNYALCPTTIPPSVQEILDDDACINLTSKSKPFWIMAKAVRDFVENEGGGCLPLCGTLPDMTAQTSKYVALQQVYQEQATKDVEIVYRRVQQLLHQLNQPSDTILEKDVKLFCKESRNLYVVRGRPIADEYDPKTANVQEIMSNLEDPDSIMVYYVLFRGVDRFYSEYNAYPGELDDQVEPDIVKLKACISKLLSEWGCGTLAKDDYVHEICRCGGSEFHTISAFIGGCAAQEAIKFLTCQYKPVNNTFIYDSIFCKSATYIL
ncbi:NEDD8-activating enzyme E1 regulatory subunit [Ischnura elegans]|uniref:NEDD8-activating enzyme E1 regulatory subunit n=1 Tax=Ischnura elegans TaxID=197161 RepID=UPI001ED87E3A|nr:NEDD8-activating enzyme E1 regulatory subunit [Ischnura elegans]